MPGPRLLILEDEQRLREVLMRSLQAEGFDVAAYATGCELLERVAKETPQALVIDIGLPDADGRDERFAISPLGGHAD